ncbi:MAG: hypothetical protein AUJ12_10305 [Alphaproteobacteria bacterium CG1_02_46_17]|nr:MAG: hypothetical protein AUJ12_10305 [Alphaproteobacteria bacterium CG1_02_46_17]
MEQHTDPREKFIAPSLFLGLAVVYNAILAILNAHVMHVSQGTVVMAEGIIVLGACAYMATKLKFLKNCQPIFLFQLVMLVIFLGVTLLSEYLNVKAFRDIFLITVFTLLGTLTSEKKIIKLFTILAAITLFFLLIEAYATELYAGLFNPASYYGATRGLENPDFNDTGLFVNALSFEGRFSLGIFDVTHRLSSIFIEQVSLGGFAMILTMFTSLFWDDLGKKSRSLMLVTIFMIVATNNSRTALTLCLMFAAGHFIFPKLPRYMHLLYVPIVLLLLAGLFSIDSCQNGLPLLSSDDMHGRLNMAYCTLAYMDTSSIFGAASENARPFWDSGYVYFINGQSLLGFVVFWLFASLLIKPDTPRAIRLNHYLNLIIFLNILTSMAFFSIKVSAPVWFIAGCFYQLQKKIAKE